VFLMALIGLKDVNAGIMCAAVLLVACSVGPDMQQDRSTGWRLGTNRVIQFRYQVIGIAAGAVLCVVLAKLFMNAFPVLECDQFSNKEVCDEMGAERWSSAFTYKLVGILKGLTNPNPHFTTALYIGLGIGFGTQLLRKLINASKRYQDFVAKSRAGFATGFALDTFLLPSPYASSFGGFVGLMTALWFAIGGILSSFAQTIKKEASAERASGEAGEEEMSTISLVGGGLIAGESLAALTLGIYALVSVI
ncbi:MAG: OPT/YSL family transporter, partial [bacterium]|nr:OPT/YSL family transporter [bacterium]